MNRVEEYTLEEYNLTYYVLRKQVKNLILKIQDGSIYVSANPYVPHHVIEGFVKQKVEWIVKKQTEQAKRVDRYALKDDEVFYFGKKKKVIVALSSQELFHLSEDGFHVYAKSETHAKRYLERELSFELQTYCKEKVAYYLDLMKDYRILMPEVRFRKMKSRWGSCEPMKHRVTFNTNLMSQSKDFIDYVVLHELVHFIQPNHSKAFYYTVEQFMPDYKIRIKEEFK